MELEKPSLAGCLSRRTNWLCHTVFTLTTHCGGGGVRCNSGRFRMGGESECKGCGLCLAIPKPLYHFTFEGGGTPRFVLPAFPLGVAGVRSWCL